MLSLKQSMACMDQEEHSDTDPGTTCTVGSGVWSGHIGTVPQWNLLLNALCLHLLYALESASDHSKLSQCEHHLSVFFLLQSDNFNGL